VGCLRERKRVAQEVQEVGLLGIRRQSEKLAQDVQKADTQRSEAAGRKDERPYPNVDC
jgi:hypothetical protein